MATASEIARMCSDDRGGGGPPLTDAELQACGVHEDSDCSTTVTNDKTLVASMTFHKTADEIIKAVEKKKEAIRRVFKMMQYAEKVRLNLISQPHLMDNFFCYLRWTCASLWTVHGLCVIT